ncbi:hypothetical protein FRC17_006061, partial [Serendipita sp. 399]
MDSTGNDSMPSSPSAQTSTSTPTRETMYSLNPNPKLHSSVLSHFVSFVESEGGENGDGEGGGSSSNGVVMEAPPPPFGSRFLTADKDVWSKNAWDHVPPPEGHDEVIQKALDRQRLAPVAEQEKEKYNSRPARYWDQFYCWNESNFFKDRKWLHNEFPELLKASSKDAPPTRIVEVGCGTGATTFPLLGINENADLDIFATDYSSKAIEVVKANPTFSTPPIGKVHASVWDLSTPGLPQDVEPESVDIVVMIFVLSALHPTEWIQAVSNIYKMLKPGGVLLMRDYGRYDLAQLRFKEDRLLEDHLYVRGDGTRVYFFTLDEISMLFTGSTLSQRPGVTDVLTSQTTVVSEDDNEPPSLLKSGDPTSSSEDPVHPLSRTSTPSSVPTLASTVGPGSAESPDPHCSRWIPSDVVVPDCPAHPLFNVEQLGVDRRLIVNRKRQLKMYR